MLELKNITKNYTVGGEEVQALKGVSLQFRQSEFVAILGPSGCGKTTMLNIIGGLDQYTSGDLIINGRSTRDFKDRDWDTYRNHSVGFVFQSYNLIPHQTVLQNVELALTLSGVGKKERREHAVAALQRVGLGDQLKKKPSEMSGGQMQRVAIARAIVNDPDIILADEPTGALDSETSLQVMDILKEIAQDRLVVMVTHNPELAAQYATRTIRALDGRIMDDSGPLSEEELAAEQKQSRENAAVERQKKRPSMSFTTSFGLSLKNLFTKKGRTALTGFAGSIGIIGIALIFSVSQGTNNYIDSVQEDTLSSYPLSITAETADMSSLLAGFGAAMSESEDMPDGVVGEQRIMGQIFAQVGTNDLKSFKEHLENSMDTVGSDLNALQYTYGVSPQIYTRNINGELLQSNPSEVLSSMMMGYSSAMMTGTNVFTEMLDNRPLLEDQYDVLAGRWPDKYNELLMVLYDANSLLDYTAYAVGLRDAAELDEMVDKVMDGEEVELEGDALQWTYDELMSLDLRLVQATDYYRYNEEFEVWEDMRDDDEYMEELYAEAEHLKVVGIVTAKPGVAAEALSTNFVYMPELVRYVIDQAADSDIVKAQLADEDSDVFSGRTFEDLEDDEGSGLNFADMISVDEDALKDAFGGGSDTDDLGLNEASMTDMAEGYIERMSTAMSALLENPDDGRQDFTDALEKLVRQMFDGAAGQTISAADANRLAKSCIKSRETERLFNSLHSRYGVPQETLGEIFQPILQGTVSGYVTAIGAQMQMAAMYSIPTPTDVPVDSTAAEMFISGYMSSTPIQAVCTQMGQTLANARMQKRVLTAFGDFIQEFTDKLKDAFDFEVDEDAIADAFQFDMDEDELKRLMEVAMGQSAAADAVGNLHALGYADLAEPTGVYVYLRDFESKEHFLSFIDDYNDDMEASGKEDQIISYTDITGVLMSSVTTIIDAVTYVLIAFVGISLVVSSIMIGVITLISVQERTKEIGILRAIGASKRNVSSMFNAETVIIGLLSGLLGVSITYLLCIPINIILHKVTKIATLSAVLPVPVAVILVIISMLLTLFAGIIPSRSAAKKDPVVALRTE